MKPRTRRGDDVLRWNFAARSPFKFSMPGVDPFGMQLRIIIADDDPLTLRSVCRLAKAIGIDVVASAETPSACMMHAVNEKPDVVLLDVNMPHGGGLDAARRLQLCGLRVVLMSGDASAQAEAADMTWGFIQKPFSRHDLERALESAMAA